MKLGTSILERRKKENVIMEDASTQTKDNSIESNTVDDKDEYYQKSEEKDLIIGLDTQKKDDLKEELESMKKQFSNMSEKVEALSCFVINMSEKINSLSLYLMNIQLRDNIKDIINSLYKAIIKDSKNININKNEKEITFFTQIELILDLIKKNIKKWK